MNKSCLSAFSVLFINDGDSFRAFKSAGISACTADPEKTLDLLVSRKEGGHPQYQNFTIPTISELGQTLNSISASAQNSVVCEDSSLPRNSENRMEIENDSESLLFRQALPTNSATANVQSVQRALEHALELGSSEIVNSNTPDAPVKATV